MGAFIDQVNKNNAIQREILTEKKLAREQKEKEKREKEQEKEYLHQIKEIKRILKEYLKNEIELGGSRKYLHLVSFENGGKVFQEDFKAFYYNQYKYMLKAEDMDRIFEDFDKTLNQVYNNYIKVKKVQEKLEKEQEKEEQVLDLIKNENHQLKLNGIKKVIDIIAGALIVLIIARFLI